MKKITAIALLCLLLIGLLSGCSKEESPAATSQPEANFLPEITAFPAATAAPTVNPVTPEPTLPMVFDEPLEEIIEPEIAEEATEEPEPTAAPTPASPYLSYNYAQLNGASFGFTMNYPTTWINLPGKHTACFQEQVTDGDYPARVAVASKKLPHKPDSDAVVDQFRSYAQQIYKQFDPKTFEFSDLQSNVPFMGKKGYAIGYLAYSGDIEVQGYMCCCAVDYTVYVFNFCTSYNDYEDMKPVLTRIRDSVALVK